jgi:transposase
MRDYNKAGRVIGLDLGDKESHYCELAGVGEEMREGRVKTTESAMKKQAEQWRGARVVMEAGTHSPWVSRLVEAAGAEAVVANPRKVQLITRNVKKRDPVDARLLARLGRADVTLLSPLKHRGAATQADLAVIKARDVAVRVRGQLIGHVRGTVKALGGRIPSCSTASFGARAAKTLPEALRVALLPLLETIVHLTQQIRRYDRQIEQWGEEKYPETKLLTPVKGVGALTSLAYVLTLEHAERFRHSRAVGGYLGLHPKRHQSGAQDPSLRITKAGDAYLRRLLVGSAQYILGRFGPDSELRRWGLQLASRGGKRGKKRAVVAVARKLAVLLHHLWLTGEVYEPLYQRAREQAA